MANETTGDADKVAEAQRLEKEGKSQRQIAAILGKPRHWVRYSLAASGAKDTSTSTVIDVPVHLIHANPHARAVDRVHVDRLAGSVTEIGLLEPIVVRSLGGEYEVMAGLHRVEAFRKLGRQTIPAIIRDADDLLAELVLIDENLIRRDLSPAEQAIAMLRRKAIYLHLHPETAHGGDRNSSRQLGDLNDGAAERFTKATADCTGIGERTIQRGAARGEGLGENVLRQVIGTALDKGEELDGLAKLSTEKRQQLVERAIAGEKVTTKTAIKQEIRAKREAELGAKQIAAPDGKFGLIVEDYEWDHLVWSRETGMDRHAANHYPVSEDAHTAQEIVDRTKDRLACAAPDCLLAMWSTVQHLAIAIDVLRLRGFDYVSHYVWGKDRIGLGHWNRNKHEILLLGVKGNIPCPAKGTQWDSLILAPTSEHSAKPDCFLEMLDAYFPTLPKLELNARRRRPGWTLWGNEVPDAPFDDPKTGEIIEAGAPDLDDSLSLPDVLRRGHPVGTIGGGQ